MTEITSVGDRIMSDEITVREIALWALRFHREEIGDHLDLSDDTIIRLGRLLLEYLNDDHST
ncbi:hypothetical protein [Thalassospira alkalitolerans]|mgnify:CR=1 FL=1|jgi:hypothetical protein|uniref:hypothetical protein n=1 Tax=Thalassospira alkalitolerans TaxID=1293890 RepID=UPI0030EEF9FD|tara:strand:+ start:508 stop:693 length:186 start_codon:yes stop_codon:yes gene_type:complete